MRCSTTEVQLLLRPPSEPALSRMMQALGRRYVAAFNRRHGRSGTIWEGRFRAGVVQEGMHTLQGLLLVDSLPVRHGEVASAQASRWSSAPHRLGQCRDPLVTDPPEFWRLGNTPFEREAAYAALLAQGLDESPGAPHRTRGRQRLGARVAAVSGRHGASSWAVRCGRGRGAGRRAARRGA